MRSSIEPMAELLRSAAKKDRFPVLLRLRVIIQHLLELLMIQSDKLAYLTGSERFQGADKR